MSYHQALTTMIHARLVEYEVTQACPSVVADTDEPHETRTPAPAEGAGVHEDDSP